MSEASIAARGATLAGLAAGVVAAALAGLALLGTAPFGAGVFVVQVVLALAWLAALDVRGGGPAFLLTVVAAATADALVASSDTPDVGRAAGVLGALFVVSLLVQLARRPRLDVTASLAGTISAATLALAAAAYLAVMPEGGGDIAVTTALFGAGAALAAGRLVDLVLPRPPAAPGSGRGIAGVLVGIGAAALVGWAYARSQPVLGADLGVRLALVAAVMAVVADLAVDAVLRAAPPAVERARSALPPLGILLPVVVAGPASYVAGRILLG